MCMSEVSTVSFSSFHTHWRIARASKSFFTSLVCKQKENKTKQEHKMASNSCWSRWIGPWTTLQRLLHLSLSLARLLARSKCCSSLIQSKQEYFVSAAVMPCICCSRHLNYCGRLWIELGSLGTLWRCVCVCVCVCARALQKQDRSSSNKRHDTRGIRMLRLRTWSSASNK